ncbi:MAG: flagellar export chaperone FlgN [Chlamydiota bacterium]|nr:flagellar export chaperone FlgN [Chlamydiota bacterium]
MNMVPYISSNKKRLEEVMFHEVTIMRNFLTSLQDEHLAITTDNQFMIDKVIDERTELASSFEDWSEELIEITKKLAGEKLVSIPDNVRLRHSEALEILRNCLDPEDFELLSLREQIEVIMREIYHLNDINAHLIQDKITFDGFHCPLPELEKPKPKSTVALLDE